MPTYNRAIWRVPDDCQLWRDAQRRAPLTRFLPPNHLASLSLSAHVGNINMYVERRRQVPGIEQR